jgi:hypothetical protein
MKNFSLHIQVVPFGDNADLFINGKHYIIETDKLQNPDDLRKLVADQPQYIYDALLGLLQEMVK